MANDRDVWLGGIPDHEMGVFRKVVLEETVRMFEKRKRINGDFKYVMTALQFKYAARIHKECLGTTWDEAVRSTAKRCVVVKK